MTVEGESAAPPRDEAVVSAAMALAAEVGWRAVTLADVSTRAGVPLAELYLLVPDKPGLLTVFNAVMDRKALAQAGADADPERDTARDRLFDALMARFEAMHPHRPGVRAVVRAMPYEPWLAVPAGPHLMRSMTWLLTAAGLTATGPRGLLNAKVLAGIYLATVRTWLDDTSEDMSATMAALDQNLSRSEQLAHSLLGRRAQPA